MSSLASAWDEAAEAYERYFVPRFAPWVAAAVGALDGELPDGPVMVPCCGTFPELPALASRHPDREIVGVDLSEGMLRVAGRRTAEWPRSRVVHGDATALPHGAAAVVSVFGLQQLPDPAAALADWRRSLRTGGVLSVVFWPSVTEDEGPFALLDEVLAGHRRRAGASWEDTLVDALGGAELVRDEALAYPMIHADAATYWTAVTTGGPLRALALEKGPQFMARRRAEYLGLAPVGPWRHQPAARWIVARG